MVNRKIQSCFLLVLLLPTFLGLNFSLSPVSGSLQTIADFSGFEIYDNCSEIASTNYLSHIFLLYNNTFGEPNWESYYYDFSSLGDFLDFDITVTIDYLYTGSMLTQVGVEIGSQYFENGSTGAVFPDLNSRIGGCGIWDCDNFGGGKYYLNVRPFSSSLDQHVSASGTLSPSGIVSFYFSRTNGSLVISILKNGASVFTHAWSEGVSRPLHYIAFFMNVHPSYCAYSGVNFTSIQVTMSSAAPVLPPPNAFTLVLGFAFLPVSFLSLLVSVTMRSFLKKRH